MFKEVSFLEELPKEKQEIFFIDNNNRKGTGTYLDGYIDNRQTKQFEPIAWFKCWLKNV